MANISSNQSYFDSEFASELRQLFYDQFGRQQNVLNFLNSRLRPQVNAGGVGYSPAALSAMRAQATDTIASNFVHARQALNQQEKQTGGDNLPSGVNAQLDAGLYAKSAEDQAAAQNDITLQNENQRQANYWRAVDVLNGTAQEQNPLGYASASLGESGSVGELANAATNVNNSGFGHQLESGLASGLASELTGGNSTGKGGAAGFFGF